MVSFFVLTAAFLNFNTVALLFYNKQEDKKILQEYENAIYIFRNFIKISKKFLIEKSENRNKEDIEEQELL